MRSSDRDPVVDALADALAGLLRQVVSDVVANVGGASGLARHYSQHENPLGKRRFLEAARRGCFASTRVGKLVLADRAAVDAYIAAAGRPSTPSATNADPDVARRRALEQAGLGPRRR